MFVLLFLHPWSSSKIFILLFIKKAFDNVINFSMLILQKKLEIHKQVLSFTAADACLQIFMASVKLQKHA